MFYLGEINNKKILKSTTLNNLEHCFTTRESVICSSENEILQKIEQNKSELCKYLKIDSKNLISPKQTHSANIEIAQIGRNIYPDTDAMILTNKEQAIFLNFADCTPIILFDKKQNIASIVHAGWRGTVRKIATKTIEKMTTELNCDVNNIVAVIGPTIGVCCYEIGEEVYEQLSAVIMDEKKEDCFKIKNGKIYADLKKINQYQIQSTGVKKVEVSEYCTCCDNDKFFSYRKENNTSSRHSAIIRLK